jgi:HEAT repeat protein
MRNSTAVAILALTFVFATPAELETKTRAAVGSTVDIASLRKLGPKVMPILAAMYREGDEGRRTAIANAFYDLGWQSDEAKAALLTDIATENRTLRLQVQWALGRVSDDSDVVDTLARIMQTDGNPLFRDKAACALAYDQIHLTERQKVRLYGHVIRALRDSKPQVRQIAAQVLQIHLGQNKGYDPNAPAPERESAVQRWERWLEEYESSL